jgi:cytochrome c oxidase accessory protein FixG
VNPPRKGSATIPLKVVATGPDGGLEQSLFEVRRKIYPRSVTGWFATWRWAMVWLTQVIFYGLPWVEWNDRQSVLFDLAARKFYIFGLVFWPQDFIYLTALLVISALTLFLFTAIAGRLWCGFACPQTVYTEIFLWVERMVEGDRTARTRLDRGPLSPRKFGLKSAKHFIWIAIALWTGFTFVAYFTPIRTLSGLVATFSLGPWEIFWIMFYGLATYGNAGFMREQVCKYMCPYARFQSVMFDRDTLVITYDTERGEPKGSRSRKADYRSQGLGDCVDCEVCVQVCPTGIDIRDGLQYECIGCAACIDGCNQVMDKMGYPRGLIRYSTENALRSHHSGWRVIGRALRPRTLAYLGVLCSVIALAGTALWLRVPLKVDVIRDRGTLVRDVEGGEIENVYRLVVSNADEEARKFRIAVSGLPGLHVASDESIEVGAASNRTFPVRVRMPRDGAPDGSHPIRFRIESVDRDGVEVSEKATFLVRGEAR